MSSDSTESRQVVDPAAQACTRRRCDHPVRKRCCILAKLESEAQVTAHPDFYAHRSTCKWLRFACVGQRDEAVERLRCRAAAGARIDCDPSAKGDERPDVRVPVGKVNQKAEIEELRMCVERSLAAVAANPYIRLTVQVAGLSAEIS